jgi:hypothetical protein
MAERRIKRTSKNEVTMPIFNIIGMFGYLLIDISDIIVLQGARSLARSVNRPSISALLFESRSYTVPITA